MYYLLLFTAIVQVVMTGKLMKVNLKRNPQQVGKPHDLS